MRISCIIPAYNAESFIAEAVDSALKQTMPCEVLVVDDGSTDATVARAQGVKIISQPHMGVAAARNAGVAAASGDVLAFLDADDMWKPEKIERQLALLKEGVMVFCNIEAFFDNPVEEARLKEKGLLPYLKPYTPSTLMVLRSDFEKVGLFRKVQQNEQGEDVDWFLRASGAGLKTSVEPGALVRRRYHSGSLTQWGEFFSADELLQKAHAESLKRRT